MTTESTGISSTLKPKLTGTAERRYRVLFIAEGVTLAHVSRPFVLARSLDSRYDVHFACDNQFDRLLGDVPFARHSIQSIPAERFMDAIAHGRAVYDTATLRGYVRSDLALLEETRPDLVVGDFRLSLSVSARVAGIPYAAICNAYWSPWYARPRYPLPELPFVRHLGVRASGFLFSVVSPLAFRLHSLPLNRIRREYGLSPIGKTLPAVYTDADFVMYADIPNVAPTVGLPNHHRYIGPLLWNPSVERPAWWTDLPKDRPIVYVTPGSSGASSWFPIVLEALSTLDVTVIAADAGRAPTSKIPGNAYIADYLPGCEAAALAELVICNGGSPTTQQALVAGTPVLGIANNLDQFLNMEAVQGCGAGELVRAGSVRVPALRDIVSRMFADDRYAEVASSLAREAARYDAPSRFRSFIETILSGEMSPTCSMHRG